jgi:hypothetical protein
MILLNHMKKISRLAAPFVLLASFGIPLLVSAAGIDTSYIKGYADSIKGIINGVLVPVLIAIAFITFLWGIYKYFIKSASNESEKGEGRMFALYGIIGFVIIFSVWGIVNIFMGTLNLSTMNNAPTPPTIGGSGTGSGSYNNGAGYNTTGGATTGSSCTCANGSACPNNDLMQCLVTSSSGTQTNGTVCDYKEIGTADGTWQNGKCISSNVCNDPGGCY